MEDWGGLSGELSCLSLGMRAVSSICEMTGGCLLAPWAWEKARRQSGGSTKTQGSILVDLCLLNPQVNLSLCMI